MVLLASTLGFSELVFSKSYERGKPARDVLWWKASTCAKRDLETKKPHVQLYCRTETKKTRKTGVFAEMKCDLSCRDTAT